MNLGCCIYEKPRAFGESSSESDDDECEHCKGHVERKHAKQNASSDQSHENSAGKNRSFKFLSYLKIFLLALDLVNG